MSHQQPSVDDVYNLSDVEQFAAKLIECAHWSARRDACDELVQALPSAQIHEYADQFKLQSIDRRLHTNLRDARILALSLHLLGKLANHPQVAALGLLARGDVARQCGSYATAMTLLDRAAQAFLVAEDRVGWARARGGWLVATTNAGRLAQDHIRQMEAVCQTLHDASEFYRLAMVEQNTGMAWQQLSCFPAALAAFERALAALAMFMDPVWFDPGREDTDLLVSTTPYPHINLLGMILANKARTLFWLGNSEGAEALFGRAQRLFSMIGNNGYSALVEMDYAILARHSGHAREALQHAKSAVMALREAGLVGHAASALTYRAEMLLLFNRDREAEDEVAEAIALLRTCELPTELVYALVMKARILARRKAYDNALRCLDEAAGVSAEMGYTGTSYQIMLERAELYLKQDRFAEAVEEAFALFPRQAVEELRAGNDRADNDVAAHETPGTFFDAPADTELDRARALMIATDATYASSDFALARKMAHALVRRGEQLRAPELRYYGYRVLARSARQEKDLEGALTHYESAITALRMSSDDLVEDQRADFLLHRDDVYMEACLVALDIQAPERALGYLEQARAHAVWRMRLQAMSRTQRWRKNAGDEPDDLETLIQQHRTLSASLRATPANDPSRAGLERQLERLSRQILDLLASQAEREQQNSAGDITTSLVRIPHQTTSLVYAVIDATLLIFVIAGQRVVHVHRSPDAAIRVQRLRRELRLRLAHQIDQGLRDGTSPSAEAVARWTRDLRETLREFYAILIQPVHDLLPPEGAVLTLVPHDILRGLPFAALYDGSRYLVQRWMVRCMPSLEAFGAVPLEPASRQQRPLLALGYSDGGTLPQAAEQVEALASIFAATTLIEGEATSRRLRQECADRTYLHLSTHGEWRRDDLPYSSYIQLADGPFHPTDVLTLDLRGCRLVTLAACQSGLGRPGGGAYIGLGQAFHAAGADAVLAALWRVQAVATRTFMERFYHELASGMEPYQALHAAQLACLTNVADPLLASPYGWAGFHLTEYVWHPQRPVGSNEHVQRPA